MTRNEMMDNVISRLGFENEVVIGFCRMCEDYEDNDWNNKIIDATYTALIDENLEIL